MALKNVDFKAWAENASGQFQNLNPKDPGQWPLLPKLAAFAAATVLTVGLGWVGVLSDFQAQLDAEQAKEPQFKQDYVSKLSQAVNLPELRKQKSQVEEYVTQLEKQLPGKAEMEALLSDINQAGVGRGLQIDLFRPGQVVVKEYYAELPISIRVAGRFHDIGAFAGDIANLSRIVTLHNLVVTVPTGKDAGGNLAMEATARTYRYLDAVEVAEAKRAAVQAAKAAKAAGGGK